MITARACLTYLGLIIPVFNRTGNIEHEAEPDKCAYVYLENMEGFDYYSLKDGADYPRFKCPECHRDALIRKKNGSHFCFSCFEEWNLEDLQYCGELYVIPKENLNMCPDCCERILKGVDD